MPSYRYAVSVMPKDGILDPQGRAVENSLPHLGIESVRGVRVGRRVELSVEAAALDDARAVVDRLARELLANPLVEQWVVEHVATDEDPAVTHAGDASMRSPEAAAGVRPG